MMILNNILRYLVWMIVCFAGMALLILACMVYFGSYVMEWVDENGKGNGHVHEVNSDIGNVLAFRLNDFADSNHYELFLWSLEFCLLKLTYTFVFHFITCPFISVCHS